jgi:ABC-2 type transport system permease protein
MLAQAILFRGADLTVVWPQFLALTIIGITFFLIASVQFRKSVAQSG